MNIFILLFLPTFVFCANCTFYTIKSGDTCYDIAQTYSITVAKLESYNSNNYAWIGCSSLQVGTKICVSSGDPPRPTADPNAECGIYAPGDLYNTTCPLNACCSKWGYCGLTSEYCGTGCVSNCNNGTIPSGTASSFLTSAYWIDTDGTMNQNVSTLDGQYDIIYYAFASFGSDFVISTGNGFEDFKSLSSSKRILSIGGWDFSTSIITYDLFRNAVNSSSFVSNVVNFVNDNGLDGVNFDWEYPGAPDIPDIPAGDSKDGERYYKMVKSVKSSLSDKLVSIAIPASYWYLKHFPLSEMEKDAVDYFVLMNYDYYGQWDYGKNGVGCHDNYTWTENSFKMLNKAGIDFSKIHGGLANYARSYELSDTSCTKVGCNFTGSFSGATSGSITNTAGIMSENELLNITKSTRTRYTDSDSMCDVMIYEDGTNWASWIPTRNFETLKSNYKKAGLGGSVLWATNYDLTSFTEPTYNLTATIYINSTNSVSNNIKTRKVEFTLANTANEILAEFRSLYELNIQLSDTDVSNYIKLIEQCDTYSVTDEMYCAFANLQKEVLNGLLSEVKAHISDNDSSLSDLKKSKSYILFYYHIFRFVFPTSDESAYGSALYLINNLKATHWAHIDNEYRSIIKSIITTYFTDYITIYDGDQSHVDLKKRSDKNNVFIGLNIPGYIDPLIAFNNQYSATNLSPSDNCTQERDSNINPRIFGSVLSYSATTVQSKTHTYTTTRTNVYGTPTGSVDYSYRVRDLPNYQNLIDNNILITDQTALDSRLSALRTYIDELPSSERFRIHVSNLDGSIPHIAAQQIAFIDENYEDLVDRGSLDETNGLVYFVRDRPSVNNRNVLRISTFAIPSNTQQRDEFPWNAAILQGYTRAEQNSIVRLAGVTAAENNLDGHQLRSFYAGSRNNNGRNSYANINFNSFVPQYTFPYTYDGVLELSLGDKFAVIFYCPSSTIVPPRIN